MNHRLAWATLLLAGALLGIGHAAAWAWAVWVFCLVAAMVAELLGSRRARRSR